MGFDQILINTLNNEGGVTTDSGGLTNYGVTQKTYDAVAPSLGLEKKSVKGLNYGEVKKVYESEYFNKPNLKVLPSERLQGLMFDFGVNAGAGTAVKKLQEIVGAKPDGQLGKKTIKAVNDYIDKYGEEMLSHDILNTRSAHYTELATRDPGKYAQYYQGWMNRIYNLKEQYGLNTTK